MNVYTFNVHFIGDVCTVGIPIEIAGNTIEDVYDGVLTKALREIKYDLGIELDDYKYEIELVHSTRGDSNE